MQRRGAGALAAIALLATVGASDAAAGPPPRDPRAAPDARYFVDGGAVPFWFGSLAVFFAAHTFIEPPDEPRLFPGDEGGASFAGDTVPESVVALYTLAGGLAVGMPDRGPRWYHVKGFGEAVLTTLAITEVVKNVVGRHRPHFDPELPVAEDRRSFFSGHASVTAASTLYLGLYLRQHTFAPARGDAALTWWELPAYLGLATLAVGVPATRLHDNRHHLSDVVAGGAVGAATAVGFYLYQESRYDRDLERFRRGEVEDGLPPLVVVPDLEHRGLSVVGWF